MRETNIGNEASSGTMRPRTSCHAKILPIITTPFKQVRTQYYHDEKEKQASAFRDIMPAELVAERGDDLAGIARIAFRIAAELERCLDNRHRDA